MRMSLLIISEGIFLFLIGNKVIFHKKYASQVDPNVKCSKQVQFWVPKLFPNDPNGVLKLAKRSNPEKSGINPEIWVVYQRVLALNQKVLAVYPRVYIPPQIPPPPIPWHYIIEQPKKPSSSILS
jgi:hypothetical protein